MSKQTKKGCCLFAIIKWFFIFFGVIFVIAIASTFMSDTSEKTPAPTATAAATVEPTTNTTQSPTSEPTATPIPTPTPIPTSTPSPVPNEMQVELAIKSVYKEENELIDASCIDGTMFIDVQLQSNLTNNYIRIGYMSDAFNVLEKLQALAKDGIAEFSKVCIAAYGTFVDIYGNESSKVAMSCTLSIDTLNKINFENATYSNLPKIADSYYIHPSLED